MLSKDNEYFTWEELIAFHEKGHLSSQYYGEIIKKILLNHRDQKRVFLVTSAVDREGKTMTALNISVVLAKQGKRTLLIDANFRNPMLAKILEIEGSYGLANVLADNLQKEEIIHQDSHFSNLHILPSGTSRGDSLEILLSENLNSFLKDIKSSYEFIMIDSSSVNKSLDPLIMSRWVDGIILVTLCDKTQKREVISARDQILKYGGKITGVVLNRIPRYMPSFYRT